jgi:hypothetical protein
LVEAKIIGRSLHCYSEFVSNAISDSLAVVQQEIKSKGICLLALELKKTEVG